MSFTTIQPSDNRSKAPHYGLVEDAEVTQDVVHEKDAKRPKPFVMRGASVTIIAMTAPYVLGMCIAAAHLVLYSYLDDKRINIDTSLPQSWVSAIALVFVNTFRMSICFSLGVAFTQLLWRRIRTTSMPLGDFDRLQCLQTDLRALLHPKTLRMVSFLSIVAALGWLITAAMILPPGSLTVVAKTFRSETEQRVPTFNSSFTGNGTFVSANEYMLAEHSQWLYGTTKQPVLATAKGALISRDTTASSSPCGANCTFTVSFDGPLVKCNTTTFTESIPIVGLDSGDDISATGYLLTYSGGWNNATAAQLSLISPVTPGWVSPTGDLDLGPCKNDFRPSCDTFTVPNKPDGFFLSQYTISDQNLSVSGPVRSYQRSTQKTSCMLHRGKYTLRTEYLNGNRILNVSTTEGETLEALWAVNRNKSTADRIPVNMTSSYQVMNIFALSDSLVQALKGEYRDGKRLITKWQNEVTVDPVDSRTVGFLRANQTIIADSVFNRARYNFSPEFIKSHSPIDLDLSEDRINEALQNITLSVMYTLDWWHTTANVTQNLNYNTFSFSSRPRLIIPYAASLLLSLPLLFLGFRALRLNGAPAIDTSFMQTLVTTTGSARLREIAAKGSETPYDVPESVKETRIRFGYMLETNGEEVVRRATFGLEDEVEDGRR